MKKNNNSLLITILGGAIFCFAFLGIAFLTTNNTKMFKSDNALPNNEIEYQNDEEISLGDWDTGCDGTEEYCPGSYSNYGDKCRKTTDTVISGMPQVNCTSNNQVWSNNACHQYTYTYASKVRKCTSCDPGYRLDGNSCTRCSAGTYSTGGKATSCTSCGGSYTSPTGATAKTSCYITVSAGKQATWTGTTHIISDCASGYIAASSRKVNVGQSSVCSKCSDGRTSNSTHTACIVSSCPAGQGADSSATTGCSNCAKNTYSPAGDTQCHDCPDGYSSSTGASVCSMTVNPGYQLVARASSATPCADGYYSTTTVTLNYGESRQCDVCTKGTSNANHTACEGEACGPGQGKDSSATTGCSNCAAGYYSPANDDECHKCNGNIGEVSSPGSAKCKTVTAPCCVTNSTGSKTTISDLNGCQQAVKGGATVVTGECPKTTNPVVTRVSSSYSGTLYLNEDEFNGYGYKTVTYIAYDQNGQVITSGLSWTVNGCSGGLAGSTASANGYSVTYKGLGCYKSPVTCSVTASLSGTDGKTSSATSSSVTIVTKYHKWDQTPYNGAKGDYPTIQDAHESSSCISVSDPYVENGVTKYKYKYNRCCGDGSPSTPEKVPYCYLDESGNYVWTSEPKSTWKKVTGISSSSNCKAVENPACYLDSNGNYVWGKYAKTTGYTLITSIKTSDACKKPSDEACYKNKYEDYQWTTTAPKECVNENSCWVPKTNKPTSITTCTYNTQDACEDVEGYKKVAGVTDPKNCAPDENPACYVYGNKFVWGKYEKITGYIKLEDIDSEAKCKLPENDACYLDPNGNYVWGKYNDDGNYTIVPSVTSMSECNNNIPTPKTDMSISKIIYIAVAILMAFGIGFIYYSSAMKKND